MGIYFFNLFKSAKSAREKKEIHTNPHFRKANLFYPCALIFFTNNKIKMLVFTGF